MAFFFKQWGGLKPDINGNWLDGRQWEEHPQLPERSSEQVMQNTKVFTIGYVGRDQESFLEALRQNQIEPLVDARRRAGSRKRGFSMTLLSESLQRRGIAYRHLPAVAPSQALRQREKDGEIDRPQMLAEYRQELGGQSDELDELLELTGRRPRRGRMVLLLEVDPSTQEERENL